MKSCLRFLSEGTILRMVLWHQKHFLWIKFQIKVKNIYTLIRKSVIAQNYVLSFNQWMRDQQKGEKDFRLKPESNFEDCFVFFNQTAKATYRIRKP